MCQACVDAIREHWPDLPEDEYGDLLYSATSYPAGDAEQVVAQIKEMAERSGRDLGVAIRLAVQDTEKAARSRRSRDKGALNGNED